MEPLLKQAQLVEKRGEFDLAALLRDIAKEKSQAKVLRRKAEKAVLCDEDY